MRQLANRSTLFWTFSSALLLIICATGCAKPQGPGPTDVVIKPVDVQVTIPETGSESALAIFNEDRALRVGDSEKVAFEVFPRPGKAFEDDELPQQVGGKYKAHTWESTTQSFGVITLDSRVVLAMQSIDNASKEQADNLIQRYTQALSMVDPKVVGGTASTSLFWELGTQRLMICKSLDYKGRITLTVAVGDEKMMDLLRMNPVFAAKDQAQAAQILQQQQALK